MPVSEEVQVRDGAGLNSKRLQRELRALRGCIRQFSKHPDAEAIHRLRNLIRRTETIITVLRLEDKRTGLRVLRHLEPVRKAAGKVRDLDVLAILVSSFKVKGEEDCLLTLSDHVSSKRRKRLGALRQQVSQHRPFARQHLKRLSTWIESVEKQPGRHSHGPTPPLTFETSGLAKARQIKDQIDAFPPIDQNNLHAFRLLLKQLINILQLIDSNETDFVGALIEEKDAIGEWHDWTVLGKIVRTALDPGVPCKLPKLIDRAVNQKYKRACLLGNALRMQYPPVLLNS